LVGFGFGLLGRRQVLGGVMFVGVVVETPGTPWAEAAPHGGKGRTPSRGDRCQLGLASRMGRTGLQKGGGRGTERLEGNVDSHMEAEEKYQYSLTKERDRGTPKGGENADGRGTT